jgi:hypothetical protein
MISSLVDENAYVAWIVDKVTKLQSKISVEAELARRAASAHGRSVDVDIIAELTAVAGLSVNGGTAADVTRDNCLDMIDFVETNDGDLEDCVFIFSTDQRKELLKIAEFSEQRLYGSDVIRSGMIPSLYGIPVIFHNGMGTTQQAFLAEKSGLVYGFQSAPAMDSQPANEYGVGATRDAMDQLYGVKGQQLGEKGLGAAESPLIAKLKD